MQLVLSQRRLSHRLLELLTSISSQAFLPGGGPERQVKEDCGGCSSVHWAAKLVIDGLLLCGSPPFVLRLLS